MTNRAKNLIKELEEELLSTVNNKQDKILKQNEKALELINAYIKKETRSFCNYNSVAEGVKALIDDNRNIRNKLKHSHVMADRARRRIEELEEAKDA